MADRRAQYSGPSAGRLSRLAAELFAERGIAATSVDEVLAGFVAGFGQLDMPGCPIGTLASEVAGRNEAARLQAAAGFDAWERLLADALERMRGRGELRAGAGLAGVRTCLN